MQVYLRWECGESSSLECLGRLGNISCRRVSEKYKSPLLRNL